MKNDFEGLRRLVKEAVWGLPIKIEEETMKTAKESKTISLPKFALSEKWGEPDAAQRVTIGMFMAKIGGSSLAEKVESINNFVVGCDKACADKKEIPDILSTLIILESLQALLTDYNPSISGFLFEAFLSALMGGRQFQVGTGSDTKIEDIQIESGENWSVKLLKPSSKITGSQKLLSNYITETGEPITYLVVQKNPKKLVFYKFTVGIDGLTQHDFDISALDKKKGYRAGLGQSELGAPLAELNFGKETDLRAVAVRYVDRLGERLVDIYNELDLLSTSINAYFVENDTAAGQAAHQHAVRLESEIGKNI